MKVKVTRHNGVLKVDIEGKLYTPLSFKSFRANPKNVSEFYGAGVRLFSVLSSGVTSALGVPYSTFGESWVGEGKYDFTPLDNQMDMFIENAPEGYFAPMIQLDTRDWYLKLHPEVPNSFTHLSQIAHDPIWRRAAADYMKAMIRHCEKKYGDRIYGYFLLCGTTTEWFSEGDFETAHPIKTAAYKKWRGDSRAAIPSPEEMNRRGKVFLSPDESEVYLARKFHSETISDLILYFTGEAQSVINHEKLLGLYYGYLFELGGERVYNDGTFDYEKVYLSDNIDMISSPSAYGYRKLSDPSAFMVTAKTLDAHNKLYFLEFDHITHVAPEEINDGRDMTLGNARLIKIPGADSKCKDEAESLNLMYRDFVLCSGAGCAMWWFDMFDGWFRSEGMMRAVSKMIALGNRLSALPIESVAEIAVFAEGESMYRARKSCGLGTTCLSDIRRTLAECGAPYDIYSIADISLPAVDKYKLYVFVNQYEVSAERRRRIRELLAKKGKRALWLYAPDYANKNTNNVTNCSQIAGITIAESEVSHGDLLYASERYSFPTAGPYFSVADVSAEPLAYFEDGSIAAAARGSSFYVATCNLPSALLRRIAKLSDVFVYSEADKVYTYPNSSVIGVYNATDVAAEINVKKDGSYTDLLTGERFAAIGGRIKLPIRELRAYMLIEKDKF